MFSGLYSSKFVTRFSLIFQKKQKRGGGTEKSQIFSVANVSECENSRNSGFRERSCKNSVFGKTKIDMIIKNVLIVSCLEGRGFRSKIHKNLNSKFSEVFISSLQQ